MEIIQITFEPVSCSSKFAGFMALHIYFASGGKPKSAKQVASKLIQAGEELGINPQVVVLDFTGYSLVEILEVELLIGFFKSHNMQVIISTNQENIYQFCNFNCYVVCLISEPKVFDIPVNELVYDYEYLNGLPIIADVNKNANKTLINYLDDNSHLCEELYSFFGKNIPTWRLLPINHISIGQELEIKL